MAVWREETLTRRDQIDALAAEARAAFSDHDLNHDVAWLSSFSRSDRKLLVLTARQDGKLVGLAPFEAHRTSLRFGLGEMTILRKRIQRFALERAPLVAADAGREATAACFSALAQFLPGNGAVFLRGVPQDSQMHALLTARVSSVRAAFHVVPFGPSYQRCRIAWDGSFESYLNSLGKVTRKDLRRTLKKADGGEPAWRLQRYTSPSDAEGFLETAAQISAKTYQRRLLGEGIANTERFRTSLSNAARTGRFLGHILFAGEHPAAFHLGHVDGSCFYMVEGGYDPAWAKAQVGILTFLHVLLDLERHHVPVSTLDYLYGGGAYKERTSNIKTPERHYYLIKRGVRGAALATAMRATDALSQHVGGVLERYKLKEFVKRQIRRMSVAQPATYKAMSLEWLAVGTAVTVWV